MVLVVAWNGCGGKRKMKVQGEKLKRGESEKGPLRCHDWNFLHPARRN